MVISMKGLKTHTTEHESIVASKSFCVKKARSSSPLSEDQCFVCCGLDHIDSKISQFTNKRNLCIIIFNDFSLFVFQGPSMHEHFLVKQTRLTVKVNIKARMHNQISAWVSLEANCCTYDIFTQLLFNKINLIS